MKNLFGKIFLVTVLVIFAQIFSSTVTFAADPPRGIPSGGKGLTEAAAIEDMKLSTVKRVLAQITERNDDENSPYQQLVKRYAEFVAKVHIDKRSRNAAGAFIVTGKVEIKYDAMQSELTKLVKDAYANVENREVYLFVRFVSQATEEQTRRVENAILQRYMTRLRENKFVIANADEVIGDLDKTRSMTFDQFMDFVKQKAAENPEICTAIVGEILMAKEDEDADGFTASCDLVIRALDCLNNFQVIDNYTGNEVLRMKDSELVNRLLFEKAAVSSAKSIADALVKYWMSK
ncbi:MAG: hypothetical protein IJ774_10455 [Selenomonadaceae bacterium]|nr:hypothetical protein [Selenomonadaceae bacterium]